MRDWFFLTGYGFYCFTSFFPDSSLLGMPCNVSFHASLFFPDWAWIILFLFMIQSFGLTGHGLYRFISCFTGSSLLGTVCIISLHASLIPHSLAWVCVVSFSLLAHHYCTLNETMQTMPSDDEPGKNEVKQYKLCPVRTIH
jgi:hypothetical protein